MKIGILGSGIVGKTLAKGCLSIGYEVIIGSGTPQKLEGFVNDTNNIALTADSFANAAAQGEVIFLAIKGKATEDILKNAGVNNFAGKIVIDVTNALDDSTMPPKLYSTQDNSLGEKIQNLIPDAKVVKAFNIVNCNIMINARMQEGSPDMFICGNDNDAKKFISELTVKWGWNSCIDFGNIQEAYWLEAMAMLWIKFGFLNNHWTHAFKLLRR